MVSRRRQRPIERGNPLLKQWQKAMIERGNPLKQVKNKTLNTHRLGLFSTDKGSKILADCQAEIRKHEFQAESQQEELLRAQAEERHRRDQHLHEQLLKLKWDLREAHEKSLKEMEELKKFQSSTFDTNARRRLVEDHQVTILGLTGKIQELQNGINCMNDSKGISGC